MESEIKLIRCPHCGATNRVPRERLKQNPICGRCHKPLSLSSATERPLDITDETFESEIMRFPGAAMVMFWSPRCPYCQKLSPVFDRLAPEYAGRARIAKFDVDKYHRVPGQYAIDGVPTLILIKNGKVLNRLVGVQPKEELDKALQSLI